MRPVIHGGDIYQNEIELDFSVNINPFGIPEKVKEAMQESLELCEHYPDIHHAKLIEKIGAHYHIPEEHILCGNGASELFVAVVHAIKPGKIVIPAPSFYGYEKAANVTEAEVSYYEMKERDGFCLTEVFLQELQENVDLLFLANPNNPVGNTIEDMLLEKICDRCREKKITVVIDECFLEFTIFIQSGGLMSTRSFSFIDGNPLSTEAILVNASSSHYGEDWSSIRHTHPFTELFYVRDGNGEFFIEDQVFSIAKDDLIIVNPYIQHPFFTDIRFPKIL